MKKLLALGFILMVMPLVIADDEEDIFEGKFQEGEVHKIKEATGGGFVEIAISDIDEGREMCRVVIDGIDYGWVKHEDELYVKSWIIEVEPEDDECKVKIEAEEEVPIGRRDEDDDYTPAPSLLINPAFDDSMGIARPTKVESAIAQGEGVIAPTEIGEPSARCTNGCYINTDVNKCVDVGVRMVQGGVSSYCDIDDKIKEQKIEDKAAENSFECLSNRASNGFCVDDVGFLKRIFGWLSSIFG